MAVIVCMVGHDFRRIIDGIMHWRESEPLEGIYLLFDKKDDKYGYVSRVNVEDLSRALLFTGAPIDSIGYNPQSYSSTFIALYNVLSLEAEGRGRKVLIDTTSTTKEAYGATVTVSLMFENVKVYIVPPRTRGWYVPGQEDPAFKEWFRKVRGVRGMPPQEIYLPGDRIDRPKGWEKKVLLELLDRGGYSPSISSLIRWLGEDASNPVVKNRFSRMVRRLERRGYVREAPSDVGKGLEFTEFGRTITKAIRRSEKDAKISSTGSFRGRKKEKEKSHSRGNQGRPHWAL